MLLRHNEERVKSKKPHIMYNKDFKIVNPSVVIVDIVLVSTSISSLSASFNLSLTEY